MVPFANAGNMEKSVNQGEARVIDLPPIESYPDASIQWFEQQGQHLPIPTETQVHKSQAQRNIHSRLNTLITMLFSQITTLIHLAAWDS